MDQETMMSGYDAGWKVMLDNHFEACMAFFFPKVWEAIEWSHPLEFLEQEFQGSADEEGIGLKRADKLVRARRKDGRAAEIFVHTEAQGRKKVDFEKRMLVYWYRIYDAKESHPISLAILTDGNGSWRPDHYEHEDLGCKIRLDFPMVKLLDYQGKEAELLASDNPFALVTLAHLRIAKGKTGNEARLEMKIALIRLLQERGYSEEDKTSLLQFLDWVMPLPRVYIPRFRVAMEQLKQEYGDTMRMLTTWEQYGLEKGVILGQIRTLKRLLTRKFGELPDEFLEKLDETEDQAILDSIEMQILFVNTLDEVVFEDVEESD